VNAFPQEAPGKITATVSCRCGKHPGHPCASQVTQEDMLCDNCRRTSEADSSHEAVTVLISFGCSVVFVNGEPCPVHAAPLERRPG
jgi:hypothetical protein